MPPFTLPTLPAELHWKNDPVAWKPNPLTITAGAKTDWFYNPDGSPPQDNAPTALFTPPDRDFLLSAKVTVEFASAFDAGTLQIRLKDDLWGKLCFEFSPQHQPMIVSVVTRGVSDDCNSAVIAGNTVYLRLLRQEQIFAFHYSLDGRYWHLVRYFSLGESDAPRVGFSSQLPTGQGCTAVFEEIAYRQGTLKDLRNGE